MPAAKRRQVNETSLDIPVDTPLRRWDGVGVKAMEMPWKSHGNPMVIPWKCHVEMPHGNAT